MNGYHLNFRPKTTVKNLGTFTLAPLDVTDRGVIFQFLGKLIQVPIGQFTGAYKGIEEEPN